MGNSDKFCLRWNDFESNVSLAFREFREDKELFDVTIACDDEQISAHKVILSACSPFFRDILRRNPHQHPLLYLKGINLPDLQNVLSFMYQGEVSVAQNDLNTFLAVAEDLKVKGLTQDKSLANRCPAVNLKPLTKSRLNSQSQGPLVIDKTLKQIHKKFREKDDKKEVSPFKSEPTAVRSNHQLSVTDPYNITEDPPSATLAAVDDGGYEEYENYEQYEDSAAPGLQAMYDGNTDIESLISKHDSGFMCLLCQKVCAAKGNMKKHIESVHIQEEPQQCGFCEKKFKNKNSLQNHISLSHRKH